MNETPVNLSTSAHDRGDGSGRSTGVREGFSVEGQNRVGEMRLEMSCVERFEIALDDWMKVGEVVRFQSASDGDECRFGGIQRSTNRVFSMYDTVADGVIGRTDEEVGDEGVEEEGAEEE